MKIFQTSDIHLGRRRLNGKLPDSDLADAFAFIANKAIEAKADVFLLVGDLFDKPQVEPTHLRQAQRILTCLKQANIPVIAIEGNHDKMLLHSTTDTWINYLADGDLLILLRTTFNADGACITPWNPSKKNGSFLDLNDIRFIGTGYLGAATPYKIREITSKLETGRPHVLLLHAGPDYFVGEGGGFAAKDLCTVHDKVHYLALGHIHKPMVYQNWACNSGSPENCELKEAAYDLDRHKNTIGRGYAIIDINTGNAQPKVNIQICSNPRRKVYQLTLDCTKFGNMTKNGTTTLIRDATKLIKSVNPESASIVDLRLEGKINFDRIVLDQYELAEKIEQCTGVTAVSIDSTRLNLVENLISNYENKNIINRETLEKETILQLLRNHNQFDINEMNVECAALFYELKEGIQANWSADRIAEHLDHNLLINHIMSANEN